MKSDTEKNILAAASSILEQSGPEGLTTRAVCSAAKVTAPTLYHHFGDKDGLMAALVEQGIAEFMERKRKQRTSENPWADLRRGWNGWIGFALHRPTLFRLMLMRAAKQPDLAHESQAIMRAMVEKLAERGELASNVDSGSAARAIQAAANGVIALFQSGVPADEVRKTADLLFDAVMEKLSQH